MAILDLSHEDRRFNGGVDADADDDGGGVDGDESPAGLLASGGGGGRKASLLSGFLSLSLLRLP